ncbi:unnamed protein product [Calicophoron daubneyi]|uniref:C2H2-type domain-containing protein n=1 Tax=Calicophoron daubneyi TaxID=300641 RepID=A0AAV2TQP1_CALDB
MTCVYCARRVSCNNLVSHTAHHFLDMFAVDGNADVYTCPSEPSCPHKFKAKAFLALKSHWLLQHDGVNKQSEFRCPHCHQASSSLSSWGEHIRRNAHHLVHCTAPGCFVKSPSRRLLMEHYHRKHSDSIDLEIDQPASALLNETVEMVCNKSESVNSGSMDTEVADGTPNGFEKLNSPSSECDPKFVFLLRCPHCDLSTVRWKHFLLHGSQCPGIMTAVRQQQSSSTDPASLVYRCHVYWCSECHAVSTEKNLVAEHTIYSHDSKAAVIRENLTMQLLNSNADPVKVELSSTMVNASVGDAQNTSMSNTSIFAPFFSTPVRPLSPIENDETESPMNLAALARPSASKLMGLSSRNQPIAAVQLPSVHLTTSCSTPASAIHPSNVTSQTTNSTPISLLQSAAALKTLQQLTAGGPDVSGFGASEAASAVAAMAAAALTGLTGFDVTSSIASVSSEVFPTGLTSIASTLPVMPTVVVAPPKQVTTNDCEVTKILAAGPDGIFKEDEAADGTTLVQKPGTGVQPYPPDDGRSSDDMVSFPFDEVKFRGELSSHMSSSTLEMLVNKMRQFSSYFVRILGKENHRRVPVCPVCGKVFAYGLGDFKRHLLTVHLEVPREYLKDCLRFTYLPKGEEKFQEVQEQLAMRQMKPKMLEAGRRRVPLPYSISILRRLISHLPSATREFLEQKMQIYSRLSVIVDTRGGFRRYKCNHCSYSSPHALADVRKHILGSHCGISTKHFRHCLQASRLDPVEFTLFPDEKLARLARDFLHRRHGTDVFKYDSRSPSPSGDFRNGGPPELSCTISSSSNGSSDQRPQDTYVSHFTAVVPGSKNRVTVRIRPPIPPDNMSADQTTQPAIISSMNGGSAISPSTPPRSSESPDSLSEFHTSTSIGNFDLNSLPSIPGIEGADRIVDLALPFSEPVLRQLMEAGGASELHIEDVLAKMRVYSTYTMNRICKGDRTVAFRCPCGRLFLTTRQPDSKIRAATLADSRRHVMGVHARIPHEFITICCQASRITREYDFQIYPDDMLLRLAMDRPIKLTNLPPVSSASAACLGNNRTNNTSLPPLKPLKDLAPYPAPVTSAATASSTSWTHSEAEDGSEVSQHESADLSLPSDSVTATQMNQSQTTDDDKLSLSDERDHADPRKQQKGLEDPLSHLTMAQQSPDEEVERIIHLPYSSEALYSLVQGYCPASYFPVLEEKMDVYSSLKVFITRRNGRRYFCCSGCSSASPHGMGDIRKHILGVHAKVPERYKAAAMHCSRLSREDNTLLPNHVLLHLAKMKWKGTVIKPLAEMDLSQFGTRRASAVGLVRQSGQFASQVYQPSTQNRDSEKLTAIQPSGQISPSSKKNHTLNYSGYDSPSSLADDLGTAGLSPLPPLTQSLAEDGDSLFTGEPYVIRIAVNSSHSADGSNITGVFYACSVCQFASSSPNALRVHVVRAHLGLTALKCAHCDLTFCTRKELTCHHQTVHSESELLISPELPSYRAALSKVSVQDAKSLPTNALTHLPYFKDGILDPDRVDAKLLTAKEVSDDNTGEATDSADLLYDNDSGDRNGSVICGGKHPSSASFEYDKSPKVPRLIPDTDSFVDPGVTQNGTGALFTGTTADSATVIRVDSTPLVNGSLGDKPPCPARTTLSGSSRRKPSKFQLVQLKPSPDSPPIISTGYSCTTVETVEADISDVA